MRGDEQVYRIETEAEVEDVSGLSAYQVGCLVLGADPEAMHRAAADYLRTAERLEATADGLRRGAADLADGWQGSAADESQHHLRQYYASARSLAAACRGSAAALGHAAGALATTRTRLLVLLSKDPPSHDPASRQSRRYQQILADLTAAYRDAATLAPTEIAVTLPPGRSADRFQAGWKDSRDGAAAPDEKGGETDTVGGAAESRPWPPVAVPAVPPVSGPGAMGHPGGGGGPGRSITPPVPGTPLLLDAPPVPESRGGPFDGQRDMFLSPYDTGTTLASGGAEGATGSGAVGLLGAGPGGPADPSGEPSTAEPAGGRLAGGRAGRAGGSAANGLGGAYPFGSQQRQDGGERERRYYLKEEREVWGEPVTPPAVLYGAFPPPRVVVEIDDEDDDF